LNAKAELREMIDSAETLLRSVMMSSLIPSEPDDRRTDGVAAHRDAESICNRRLLESAFEWVPRHLEPFVIYRHLSPASEIFRRCI
jgi:hypothetical protein